VEGVGPHHELERLLEDTVKPWKHLSYRGGTPGTESEVDKVKEFLDQIGVGQDGERARERISHCCQFTVNKNDEAKVSSNRLANRELQMF